MRPLDFSADALTQDRARLLALLTEHAFERRKVVLASGRESDFYIDCRKVALTAEGHALIGRLFLAAVPDDVVAVGGLTLGADPLASAVSLTSFLAGRPVAAFLVRKAPKGHGTGQWVERPALPEGAKVVVLEDVITTGGSALKALQRARAEGLDPVKVLALVDRMEGGRKAIEAAGIPVESLFRRTDFIPEPA